MKGSLRKIHDHLKNKTNFNDWSDPKFVQIHTSDSKYTLKRKSLDLKEPEIHKESILSQTSIEIEDIRRNVKAGHPLLSLKEVRHFRLPFHKSLLLNLLDAGFIGVHHFIKEIIDLDEAWHKMTHKNYPVKKRPQLKSNECALRILSDGLIAAEKTNREGSKTGELSCFMDLALQFTKLDDGVWDWLSEELYEQCIHITNMVQLATECDRELTAIVKFLYAKFLLDILHEPDRAKGVLEESMKLSEGKFYNASVLTGNSENTLYIDSCILLHRILLVMADEIRESSIENAIELYKHSLHWAKVVSNKPAETTALLNLVDIYIAAKQLDKIPEYLENYLKLCADQSNISGICEGYILSAKFHDLIDEHELENEDLQALLKTAEENDLLEMVALAHHKLAIFYLLHKGNHEDAQSHATDAYNCYIKLHKRPEIEASSCLVGICQGQRVLPHYIQLLLKSDKASSDNYKTLMKWLSLRIRFFSNIKLLQIESEQNAILQKEMENFRKDELNDTDSQNETLRNMSIAFPRKSVFPYRSRLSKINY